MKKILFIITYAIISLYCYNVGQAQWPSNPGPNWLHSETQNTYITDLDVAMQLSKETKQALVLIFSADWCGHCKNLKRDFPLINEFDDKIVCILDSDKEKQLSRKFKIRNLPSSIMLDSNGNEISRIVGYDKITYSKWLKNDK